MIAKLILNLILFIKNIKNIIIYKNSLIFINIISFLI